MSSGSGAANRSSSSAGGHRRNQKKGPNVIGMVVGGVAGLAIMYAILVMAGVSVPGFPAKKPAASGQSERRDGRPSGVRNDFKTGSLDDLSDKFKTKAK